MFPDSLEYDAAGAMVARHVHNVGADVPLVSYDGADLSTSRHLFADHQGSIVALVDGDGALVGVNSYDEYGIPGAGNSGRFQYTGQAWLAELGLYYYKARIYSPTLGRFLQTDPIGYQDQFNLYAYVRNDPINNVDPTGTTCEERRNGTFCRVDDRGSMTDEQVTVANASLTLAYHALLAHPDVEHQLTVDGVTVTVTAGEAAAGLAQTWVVGGDMSDYRHATVTGGSLDPERNDPEGRPIMRILGGFSTSYDSRYPAWAEEPRAVAIVHDAQHTVASTAPFRESYSRDPNRWNILHQRPFNAAARHLYHGR